MHIIRALFLYDSNTTGVQRVLCPNDSDNTHGVRTIMAELPTIIIEWTIYNHNANISVVNRFLIKLVNKISF